MLGKLVKRCVYEFKNCIDLSYKLKIMTPQSWACLGLAKDIKVVGSKRLKRFPHESMVFHLSIKS